MSWSCLGPESRCLGLESWCGVLVLVLRVGVVVFVLALRVDVLVLTWSWELVSWSLTWFWELMFWSWLGLESWCRGLGLESWCGVLVMVFIMDRCLVISVKSCGCCAVHQVLNEDGLTSSIRDKILTITVKKGWKQGTRITFPQEGDQGPNNTPGSSSTTVFSFSPVSIDQGLIQRIREKKNLTVKEMWCFYGRHEF